MSQYRSFRDSDWALILTSLFLAALGWVQIYSVTHDNLKFRSAIWKQAVFLAVGIVLFYVFSRIDYRNLLGQSYLFYGIVVAALVFILIGGATIWGSRRWIKLPGGFLLQVSEFAKIVVVLLVARFVADQKSDLLRWQEFAKLVGLVFVPWLLVAMQPDLGTSLTYLPVLGIGVLFAGLRWQYWVVLLLVIALLLPMSWFLMRDYQRDRVITLLDPEQDPKGKGYQVIQSLIAIGNGGTWGKGVTQGTQTRLQFLPVSHTDFIFSAFAEEHGFVGVTFTLAVYFLLLMLIVRNAQQAPDKAGILICMGIAALLLFHIMENVGMVVGRMPVAGIPLPLMSSGGSNTLTVCILLGLVNNVRIRRFQ